MRNVTSLILLCLFAVAVLSRPAFAEGIPDGRYVVIDDPLPLEERQKRLFGYTVISIQSGQLVADYLRPPLDPPDGCSWQDCLDHRRIFTTAVELDADRLRLGDARRPEASVIDTPDRDESLYVQPLHGFLNGARVTPKGDGYLLERDGAQMTLAVAQAHNISRSFAYLQATELNAHGFDHCVLRQMLEPGAEALRDIMAVEVERQALPLLSIQNESDPDAAAMLNARQTVFVTLPVLQGDPIEDVTRLRDRASAQFGSMDGYQVALDALIDRYASALLDWLAFRNRFLGAIRQGTSPDAMIARICNDALLPQG